MADQQQRKAAAWPPRTRIGLTAPCAGRIEMDDALLPLHLTARALPPSFLQLAAAAEAQPSPLPPGAPSSPRALAAASHLAPSRPPLPRHLLYLVHPLVEPLELNCWHNRRTRRRHVSTSPEIELTAAGALEVSPFSFMFSDSFAVKPCSSYHAWVGQCRLAVAGVPPWPCRRPPCASPL